MKKSLQAKLKGYAALAGSVAAVSGGAQVVYVDINPDTVLHDSIFYNLDFNNDAVVDFQFVTGRDTSQNPNWVYSNVLIQGAATNAIESSIQGPYTYPIAFNVGDTIKSNAPDWVSYAQASVQYLGSVIGSSTYGNFRAQTDKYMGARFDISGVTHYGWVRLGVNATADTMIIKEYAYELQADSSIVIGMQTGVQAHQNSNLIRVHSYDHSLFVHTAEPQNGGTISVYNMNGQLIREEEITSGEMTISLAGETTGMYVVHIRQGEAMTTRKVYLK